MRFSVEQEGSLVRVRLILRRMSDKSAKQSLKNLKNQLGQDARVLLEITEAGHLNASEISGFIRWVCDTRAAVKKLAVYTHDRSFLALLELVCGHHIVKIAQDETEAMRFLLPESSTSVGRNATAAANLVQSI